MAALRFLVRALIPTIGLTLLLLLYLHGANVGWWGFDDDGGLATGLLGFALVLLVAGIWGLVDGARRGLGAALVWVVVAVLCSLTMSIGVALVNGSPLVDAADDLTDIAPVVGGFVLAGGVLGALIGGAVHALTHRRRGPASA